MTLTTDKTENNSPLQTKFDYVWDPLVRVFHWALVSAFIIAFITEDDYLFIHSWAGYTILSLLAVRILWGVVGTKHAKFSDFIFSRREISSFIKDTFLLKAKRYIGHNPAGGAMVIILIISLLLTASSGLVIFALEEGQGPLATLLSGVGNSWGDLFEELHEFFANFTLLLIFIHVVGVIVESVIHKENLIKAMFTGKKRR